MSVHIGVTPSGYQRDEVKQQHNRNIESGLSNLRCRASGVELVVLLRVLAHAWEEQHLTEQRFQGLCALGVLLPSALTPNCCGAGPAGGHSRRCPGSPGRPGSSQVFP